jgi:hypothetical protein
LQVGFGVFRRFSFLQTNILIPLTTIGGSGL